MNRFKLASMLSLLVFIGDFVFIQGATLGFDGACNIGTYVRAYAIPCSRIPNYHTIFTYDYLLVLSFVVSLLCFLNYRRMNSSLTKTIGIMAFYYGIFISVLVYIDVVIMNKIIFALYHPSHLIYPFWSEQAFAGSCFVKASDYTPNVTNCNFINYYDVFYVGLVCMAIGMVIWCIMKHIEFKKLSREIVIQ